jgi:hypothetical protein
MMTTTAALLGGLPLALEHGMGSELRRPLGISIVGGLDGKPGPHVVHRPSHLSCIWTGYDRSWLAIKRSCNIRHPQLL